MTEQSPPYLRIADDIRHRIAAGELRPGDHVPSARRITQEFGVALATATKVLATLQSEGLTKAVPGIGTVVATRAVPDPVRPTAPVRGESDVTRERVVRAAMGIADREGMAQLTMRRIATELGAATMSLYRHVPSKEDLVVCMIDTALGEEPLPADPPAGWRARLELSSRLQWKHFRRHPWLAPALSMSRPQLIPNGMRHTEWALAALDGLGLTVQEAMDVHVTVFGFARGLALNLEREAQDEADTGMTSDEWTQTHEADFTAIIDAGGYPMMRRLLATELDLNLDTLFEFGLARLLDGFERYFASPPPPPAR